MKSIKTTIPVSIPAFPIYFVAFVGFVLSVLAFFPGWMSPDSLVQYVDAKTATYIDWHPVLFSWWWGKLDSIFPGPALMLFQSLILYWGAWLLIALASRRWLGRGSYLIPLLGFWPGLLYPLGQIWKDIAFATATFFSWALVLQAYAQVRKLRWYEVALLLGLSTFAFGVKTNGVTALPFLFAFFTYVQHGRKMIWRRMFIMPIIWTLAAVLIANALVPEARIKKTSPFQYTQTYDLLAISVKTGKILLPDYITNRIGNTLEKLKPLYWPGGNNLLFYNTAGNMTTVDPRELSDLRARWIDAVIHHPAAYWEHRWQNFVELLRWGAQHPASVAFPTIVSNEYGFAFKGNVFSDHLSSMPDRYPYLFFPWIYLATLLMGSVALLLVARDHRVLIFCFTGSALSFVLPHVFIAPAADYRYLYYAYFCSVICMFFAAALMGKSLYSKMLIKPQSP